jgi:hypothetical protein
VSGFLIRRFIRWAVRRSPHRLRVVVAGSGLFSFSRFEFLWPDEWVSRDGLRRWNRPPWYRPFNALLHCWNPKHDGEKFHDHPRWSITICLRGKLIERTPWGERILTPGSIVIRSRKAIHAFQVPKEYRGKTWTIFVVGRRNHSQNIYTIQPQSVGTAHSPNR